MSATVPVFQIPLPEYIVEAKPDADALGHQLDRFITERFPGRRLAIRGIGLQDHPGLTLDELTARILHLGTDRYAPDRPGVHEEMYRGLPIDLFATPCRSTADGLESRNDPGVSVIGGIIADFYHGALSDRGYAVRLDLLMIYDREQLDEVDCNALWPDQEPEPESTAYAFRFPDRKADALFGIVQLLR